MKFRGIHLNLGQSIVAGLCSVAVVGGAATGIGLTVAHNNDLESQLADISVQAAEALDQITETQTVTEPPSEVETVTTTESTTEKRTTTATTTEQETTRPPYTGPWVTPAEDISWPEPQTIPVDLY